MRTMTLDRLHQSEKRAYAFTVQMGLLAFLEEKYMGEGVFIAVQQQFEMCLAVLLGACPSSHWIILDRKSVV